MNKETTYNISLKGQVGGSDFDRSKVDKTLAINYGKQGNKNIVSLEEARVVEWLTPHAYIGAIASYFLSCCDCLLTK